MKKLIFVDVDGVLNSEDFFIKQKEKGFIVHSEGECELAVWEIDDTKVELLNKIITETNCKLVLSSSWRFNWRLDSFTRMLRHHGFKFGEEIFLGTTPLVDLSCRGAEIRRWLIENEFAGKFIILDDNDDMAELKSNLFLTNWDVGLTESITNSIIEYLNDSSILPPFINSIFNDEENSGYVVRK